MGHESRYSFSWVLCLGLRKAAVQQPARSVVSSKVWSPLPSSVVDRTNFLATIKLMSTSFFNISRRASLLQAPNFRWRLRPSFKGLICSNQAHSPSWFNQIALPGDWLVWDLSNICKIAPSLLPYWLEVNYWSCSLSRVEDYSRELVIGVILELQQPTLASASYSQTNKG